MAQNDDHPYLKKYARWVTGHPVLTLLGVALVMVAFGAFLPRLRLAQLRTEEQLRQEAPASHQYQLFMEEFGSDLDILITFQAKDGLFTPENVERLRQLTYDFERLDAVERVISLATANYLWLEDETFSSRLFLDAAYLPETPEGYEALREQALAYEPFQNLLINDDATVACFVLRPLPNMQASMDVEAQARALIDEKYADLDLRFLGEVVVFIEFQKLLVSEAGKLLGICLLVIFVLLWVCFRSFWGIVVPGFLTISAIYLTIASFAVLDHTFSGVALMVLVILLVVSLCDSIHYFENFQKRLAQTGNRIEANQGTIAHIWWPCLFTSLTTAAGFASCSVATNLDLVYLAIHASLGALIAFALTFTLLPALLTLLPVKPKKTPKRRLGALRLLDWVIGVEARYGGRTALGLAVLTLVICYNIRYLTFDQDNLEILPKDHRILADTRFLAEEVGIGGTTLQLVVKGEPGAIKNREHAQAIARLEQALREIPGVRKIRGLVDEMKIAYSVLQGNDPDYYRLPEDEDKFNRLFHLVSNNEDMRSLLNFDHSKTVISISMDQALLSHYENVFDKAMAFVQNDAGWPAALTVEKDGFFGLVSYQYNALMNDQIRGFSLAMVLITLLMSLLFKSFKIGFISMVPNLLPVFVVLGYMALMGIYVSSTLIVVINVALGLAVDDTIHFLYAYRHNRQKGESHDVAMAATFRMVGRPLVFTSFVLILGMVSLNLSSIPMMQEIGQLLTLPILAALLYDFFLLPYLLKIFYQKQTSPKPAFRKEVSVEQV